MRAQDTLSTSEYTLLRSLRNGPQRHFYNAPTVGLRDKGFAALDPITKRLVITDEGMKVGRMMRRAG